MKLKQLEYFVSVAENLNFTRAAKKCYISQTAMTLQIKTLEEQIGVPLFVRDKHHVELTPAGKVYLNEARDILGRAEVAVKLARQAGEGTSGVLKIGFIRGYEQSSLSDVIRKFHELFPNITLSFFRDNMSALFSALEDDTCDVIFNLAPYVQTYPRLQHHFLKSYPMMAVLYPGHPFCEKKELSYSELRWEDFIIMQPQGRADEEAEETVLCFSRGGFVPNIVGREREVQTMLLMVSAGLGIAILPEYAVRYFSKTKNLVLVPLKKPDGMPETLDFELCWKGGNENAALLRLLEWICV